MRQRLSWNEEKVADIMKQADPYTMNQTRTNPPAGKYDVGGPSDFAEDQNKNTPWKNEGRTETGHPAPAREAVVQARKLEDKALKCITIAQRMLPGSTDEILEDQATDLMFLPEKAIMATLSRQAALASKIAGETKEDEEKEEKEEKEVEAAKCEKEEKEEKEEVVEAAKKEEEKKEEEVVEAAKNCDKEEKEEEVVEAAKKEEELDMKKAPKEEEVTAADKDLLDILFDGAEVVAEAPKTGAKKLSGLVKKASGSDPLANLWDTPPDVSSAFK